MNTTLRASTMPRAFWTRLLSMLLLLAVAAASVSFGAHAADVRDRNRERERNERPEERSDYRAREANPERLSKELRDSPLYRMEGKDADGNEQGHTLRRHVPDRGGRQEIDRLVRERDRTLNGDRKPDLSMYMDVKTAERAISRTENSDANKQRIDNWMKDKDPKNDRLTLYGTHEENVGVHYARGADRSARIDTESGKVVDANAVVLRKDGKGGYYVLTSYPIDRNRIREQQDE